jgi:hypothetical protein
MTDQQQHSQPPAPKAAKPAEEPANPAVVFEVPAVSVAERRKELIAQAEANEAANDAAYEKQIDELKKLPQAPPHPAPAGARR